MKSQEDKVLVFILNMPHEFKGRYHFEGASKYLIGYLTKSLPSDLSSKINHVAIGLYPSVVKGLSDYCCVMEVDSSFPDTIYKECPYHYTQVDVDESLCFYDVMYWALNFSQIYYE